MREFDVVLWGATGAVGRRAAHHLAHRTQVTALKCAIGGRSPAKLEAVRNGLGEAFQELPILVGDNFDRAFLNELAARTRVVVSTVGPFDLYGSDLVAACATAGTHYCDLTGEVHWMRRMIDAHEIEARASGARLVFACGHDSIPSDIGVFLLQRTASERFGKPCDRVVTRITKMRGGFSGGTAASFLNAMEKGPTDPAMMHLMQAPYALNPEGERDGPDPPDRMMPVSVTWDPHLKAWTKPYFMAPMNAKTVRRTNVLLGYPYGEDFSYEESAMTSGGIGGWISAMRYSISARADLIAMAIPPIRAYLKRNVLPKSGEGPSAEVREKGHYEIVQLGLQSGKPVLRQTITGQGDPGVESTSRMLVEAALCLAEDEDQIDVGGGCWTPASAMGLPLAKRVEAHAGLQFALT